jgi:hypothetical protein
MQLGDPWEVKGSVNETLEKVEQLWKCWFAQDPWCSGSIILHLGLVQVHRLRLHMLAAFISLSYSCFSCQGTSDALPQRALSSAHSAPGEFKTMGSWNTEIEQSFRVGKTVKMSLQQLKPAGSQPSLSLSETGFLMRKPWQLYNQKN